MAIYLCPHYWMKGSPAAADGGSEAPLTARMQKATAAIHDVADAAVNAKLVLAFSDRRVYGRCLAAFYHVYGAVSRGA